MLGDAGEFEPRVAFKHYVYADRDSGGKGDLSNTALTPPERDTLRWATKRHLNGRRCG